MMTAATKIERKGFGLWSECPEDAPVAWGARAIADQGVGFSIVYDRQSWNGDENLRKAFSKLINAGPLRHANDVCRGLRHGWTPFRDLECPAFIEYWNLRKREEPELFRSLSSDLMVDFSRLRLKTFLDADPREVWRHCRREMMALEEWYAEEDRREKAGEEPDVPDPPPACESSEDEDWHEECEQEFNHVPGRGWEGCEIDCDAWVCTSCGYMHCFDDEEMEEYGPPKTPYCDAYREIAGPQVAKMSNRESQTFTLFDDGDIVIKGNTNASGGYVNVIAYPKHDVVDLDAVLPGSEHPGFKSGETEAEPGSVYWSGPFPIPRVGDTVVVTRPDLGPALVLAHQVHANYLFLVTIPEGVLPEWWEKQREEAYMPGGRTWKVAGVEIALEDGDGE